MQYIAYIQNVGLCVCVLLCYAYLQKIVYVYRPTGIRRYDVCTAVRPIHAFCCTTLANLIIQTIGIYYTVHARARCLFQIPACRRITHFLRTNRPRDVYTVDCENICLYRPIFTKLAVISRTEISNAIARQMHMLFLCVHLLSILPYLIPRIHFRKSDSIFDN